MGTEAVIGGLFGLASAGVSAYSDARAQSAQASAQADLNKQTMEYNSKEAQKAREFSAHQGAISRSFNKAEALAARSFTAAQAKQMMDFNASEAQRARVFNRDEAGKARTFDAQQSLLARQFEERMSSTAHQREVQDLRKAGLNPILSATGGNGASTPSAPIIASPVATSPAASMGLGSSAQASSQGSGSAAASIGAMQALRKGSMLGDFFSSALDLVKANADLKRAEAEDKKADAYVKETVQHIEESISRVGLNHDEHELNIIRKRGEEAQARLYEEKVLSEIQKRHNDMKISEAMQYNLRKTADAAAAAASAQAHLANLKDEIEHAESPARIRSLIKQADMYDSVLKKNEWAISDPKAAAQRKWWRENPEAAHANEFLDILGNVVHGSVGIHGGN